MSESCQFLCEQTKLPLVGYRRAGKLPCYMPIPAPPTSLTFPHRNQDQSSSERQRLKVRAHDEDDPLINPFVDSAPLLASLACGRVLMCIGEGVVLRGLAYYGPAQGQRLARRGRDLAGAQQGPHVPPPGAELRRGRRAGQGHQRLPQPLTRLSSPPAVAYTRQSD